MLTGSPLRLQSSIGLTPQLRPDHLGFARYIDVDWLLLSRGGSRSVQFGTDGSLIIPDRRTRQSCLLHACVSRPPALRSTILIVRLGLSRPVVAALGDRYGADDAPVGPEQLLVRLFVRCSVYDLI